jgi:uncharacterized protein YjbI with pentapeptide repeats
MSNRVIPSDMVTPSAKRKYFRLTLNELLTILCTAAVPISICIYTAVDSQQQSREAEQKRQFDLQQNENRRQQDIYDKFIEDMYTFDRNGHLNDSAKPWAFANSRYWSAHRQWTSQLKVDALIFLKRRSLIGRQCRTNDDQIITFEDIIKLNELNFDYIHLKSQTNGLVLLNMTCVHFDQISLIGSLFQLTNIDGATFEGSCLNDATFEDSSLVGVIFKGTQLRGTNFGTSNLQDAQFIDVDLTDTKLTEKQLQQASFVNSKMPDETESNGTTRKILEDTGNNYISISSHKKSKDIHYLL